MTVKERILERLAKRQTDYADTASQGWPCQTSKRVLQGMATAYMRAIEIVTEEFAKEGEDGKA